MIFGWEYLSEEDEERIAAGIVHGKVYGGPWHLELQPTNRCNLKCFFCPTRHVYDNEVLDWELLRSVLEKASARDLRFLRLSGGGESLSYPQIRELLDLCVEQRLRITDLTTNGAPLVALAEQVVATGADIVNVSLNEPDAELYAHAMQTSPQQYEQALAGVAALNAARNKQPSTQRPRDRRSRLHIKFLIWNGNFRRMSEMRQRGQELNADRIMINSIFQLDPQFRLSPAELTEAKELLREIITEDCAGERRLAFDLSNEGDLQQFVCHELERHAPAERHAPTDQPGEATSRCAFCYMAWFSALISATGKVYPCCNFAATPSKELGDLRETDLADIWRGSAFQQMRAEFRRLVLLKGELEHSCKGYRFLEPMCIPLYQCPFTHGLCSERFYRRTLERMQSETSWTERLSVHVRDLALRAVHRAKAAWRK